MKKFLALVLVMVCMLAFAFTGCSNNESGLSATEVSRLPGFELQLDENDQTKKIMVRLNLNGGYSPTIESNVILAEYGEQIQLPIDIEKDGCKFVGWFYEEQQITDKNGAIEKRDFLNAVNFAISEDQESTVVLTAVFDTINPILTIVFPNGEQEKVEVVSNSYLKNVVTDSGWIVKSFSKNPSGTPKYQDTVKEDITLYAINYEKTVYGRTISTENENGFNPSRSGSSEQVALHKSWDLGNVKINQNVKSSSTEFVLSYCLTQDPHNLPKGKMSDDRIKDVWLNNDSYSERVFKTNINGQSIGYGAYYVEVCYVDGDTREYKATNFLANACNGEQIQIAKFSVKSIPVESIRVSVVYELSYNNPYSHWLGVTWSANYRQNFEINF